MIDVEKAIAILNHHFDTVTDEEFLENIGAGLEGEVLEQLPPQEKRIIELYHHEGMTCREIGQAIGIPESQANQLYSQALDRIRAFRARNPQFALLSGAKRSA